MKKCSKIFILLILTILAMTATSVTALAKTASEDSINLGATASTQLIKGSSKTLKTSLTGKVTWKSSDKTVVTVSSSGKVTAKKLGTATITAKSGSKTQKFTIVVTSKNLVKNGDASQKLKYWTDKDKVWETRKEYDGTITAHDSYFFMPRGFKGKDGAKTRIYQDISIKAYAGKKATLSACNRTWSDGHKDSSIIRMDFYNSSGKIVGSAAKEAPHKAKWNKVSVSKAIPNNAVKVRVSLYSVYHYGSESDSYYDHVTLFVS